MKNIDKVNNLINKVLPGYLLVQAKGYCYFTGNDALNWTSSTVYVNKVKDQTPEEWLLDLKGLIKTFSPCPLFRCKEFKKP